MSEGSGTWDPSEVIEEVLAPKKTSNMCWATLVPEHVAETLEILNEYARSQPGRINRAALKRALDQELEHSPSKEAIGRHFRGECQCGILKEA